MGTIDPNPSVAGQGIAQLRAAGIAVDLLDLPAAKQLIAPFIAGVVHHRPYVTLKWAQTADGVMASAAGPRLMISGDEANRAVHRLRSRCDAIVVGASTVIADDPLLTVRGVSPMRVLRRIVLDPRLRIPLCSKIVTTAREHPTLVCTTTEASQSESAKALDEMGVEIAALPSDENGRLRLSDVFSHLYEQFSATHVLVEGGPTLSAAMLEAGCVDRMWIIKSPRIFENVNALEAPAAPGGWPFVERMLGEDRLIEYLNRGSEVFFAAGESADFLLEESSDD